MYNLPHFKISKAPQLLEFMRDYPFAMLTAVGEDGTPVATQVPVFTDEVDGKLILSGHIMKQTDHHKGLVKNPGALVVFTGPHAFVSADWYTDPQQASTWNYMAVHARGNIQFADEDALVRILERTTNHFLGRPDAFQAMTPEYVQKMATAILAFTMEIHTLDHVFKLSQNKDEQTFRQIIDKLEKGSAMDALTASAMKKYRK